ncbi:MAG TPA: hypothetical protein DHV63_13115 [Pseudomonas sp.]|nr:hypothetical protein [Pseudomonas sp.]
MTYHNVVSAVVRAMAAETINSAGGCDFEPKVQTAKVSGEIGGKDAALLADAIVFKILHAELSPRHWSALLAKYSTHKGRKVEAIGRLVAVVPSPAPQLFTRKAVTAWAIPQVKGVQRVAATFKAEELPEGTPAWRVRAHEEATARANQREQQKASSRSADMIVLSPSNYDMTTWDSQGLTERTYQRWNKSIKGSLEGMVNEALAQAQEALEAVGLLISDAA